MNIPYNQNQSHDLNVRNYNTKTNWVTPAFFPIVVTEVNQEAYTSVDKETSLQLN